ncbi:MAG TPA: ATP-dependent RNA helicase DbpA [Xanthomonadaceae bacterium]|jgi:ATP-independent RNA helicase DbpA|nr:ATP-dependent RNA helicase DbpA [Xanthomonadaceae bacterium]
MTDFTSLPLQPALLQAVATIGYTLMTPIQAQSLPPMLEGRDVIAQAMTGSGKTAAFGLALLAKIDADRILTQALVLCPTRELADQVSKEIRRLASGIPNVKLLTLCGGIPLRPQLASLQHPPHIVVGTPGRIQDLLTKEALFLDALKVLVLDEADRMLDMGFEEEINAIVKQVPAKRQTLLFSATWPESIRAISGRFQRDPVAVTIETTHADTAIEQHFFEVEPPRKVDALALLLATHKPESALVFCNTRRDVDEVAEQLSQRGHVALALHGDMEQRDRDEVLLRFANRSCSVLVATDVAARGLDIKELPAVVSYELPTDADAHVHRIGRTGRAGNSGLALSLVAAREINRVGMIESALGIKVRWGRVDLSQRPPKPAPPTMVTLAIDGGRQDKLRPGDIVGALTGEAGLHKDAIGKIDTFATRSYVAVRRDEASHALERLRAGKIKGRNFRVRRVG